MLERIYTNKYVFFVQSFLNDVKNYGCKNAAGIVKRLNNSDYKSLKAYFEKNEYCKNICLPIEKKAGSALRIDDFEKFGYCVIAPVIYEYISTLCDRAKDYDEIWFLSREGWLLKSAFDIYVKKYGIEIKSRYFLASRRATSVAAVKTEEDIKNILMSNYSGGVKNLFKARLGVSLRCDDFNVSLPEDIQKVMEIADIEKIISQSREENKNYRAYIGKAEKVIVADVGYQGTIQYYLSKITGKKIDGYYICSHYKNKPQKTGCNCESLFPVINMREERTNRIFKNQLYFEAVLKAPFGQLLYFDKNAKPVYNDENDYDENVSKIQKGILYFMNDFDCRKIEKTPFTAELCDILINNNTEENILKSLVVEDRYCSDSNLSAKKGEDNAVQK